MIFQARKCNNDTLLHGELPCEDEDKIDEYARDIMVETWVIQEKIYFKD